MFKVQYVVAQAAKAPPRLHQTLQVPKLLLANARRQLTWTQLLSWLKSSTIHPHRR